MYYKEEVIYMKGFTKLALTLAAAGGVCYLFKDKIAATKAYQTVESNDTVRKAKATAGDTYHKVRNSEPVRKFTENEKVKKAASSAKDTYNKVKESEAVQKAKSTAGETYNKVKDSETVQKAKAAAEDTYNKVKDKVKDTLKDKTDSQSDSDREYFTLHEGAVESDAASQSEVSDIETAAKTVSDTVAESEGIIAEAANAMASAVESKNQDVLGDEYMGLSDVSEDPVSLEEQDKLDV